jgi:hypothetical protein
MHIKGIELGDGYNTQSHHEKSECHLYCGGNNSALQSSEVVLFCADVSFAA